MSRARYTPQQRLFYYRYIKSAAWQRRKSQRIEIAGRRCEFVPMLPNGNESPVGRCPRRRYLCVHHNNYERLGREHVTDLNVLCWAHHMLEHLLWKKCYYCKQPSLLDDTSADGWLNTLLYSWKIDLDRGPVVWSRLPNKEKLLIHVPEVCDACSRYIASGREVSGGGR